MAWEQQSTGAYAPVQPGNGVETVSPLEIKEDSYMGPRIELKRQGGRVPLRRNADPVKLTALIYLKEALLREKYEDCADFVAIAREFGALPVEIRTVLENPAGVIKFSA